MVKKNKYFCSVCKTTTIHSFYSQKNTICKECCFIKLENLSKENIQLKETISQMKNFEDKNNEEMDEIKSILLTLESKSEYLTLSLTQKNNELSEKDIEIQKLQQIIDIQSKNYEALLLENNQNLRKISNFSDFTEKASIFELEEVNEKSTKIKNDQPVKQNSFSRIFLCRKI